MKKIILIIFVLFLFYGCSKNINNAGSDDLSSLVGKWININGFSHGNIVINENSTFEWENGYDVKKGKIIIKHNILTFIGEKKTIAYKYSIDSSGTLRLDLVEKNENSYTLYFKKM